MISGTEDKEDSWWRMDLTEKYALYLTHDTAYQYSSTGGWKARLMGVNGQR